MEPERDSLRSMADIADSSEAVARIRQEAAKVQRQIESGEICRYCHTAECDRIVMARALQIGADCKIPFRSCLTRFQAEQAKQHNMRGEERDQTMESLRLLAYIPPRFEDSSFAGLKVTPDNSEAIAAAQQFVSELAERKVNGRGLLLLGPTGTGKTRLGTAILNAALTVGIGCRYCYSPKLLDVLREKVSDETLGKLAYSALYEVKVLLLDEIGLADAKDPSWSVSVYSKVINERYTIKRPTIMTTNLNMQQLESAIGARSISRIIESSDIVECGGRDWRLEANHGDKNTDR